MTNVITKQQLVDAAVDALNLNKFMNEPADIVLLRNGEEINSVAFFVASLQAHVDEALVQVQNTQDSADLAAATLSGMGIKILSATEPTNPWVGLTWYDLVNKKEAVWDGNNWKASGGTESVSTLPLVVDSSLYEQVYLIPEGRLFIFSDMVTPDAWIAISPKTWSDEEVLVANTNVYRPHDIYYSDEDGLTYTWEADAGEDNYAWVSFSLPSVVDDTDNVRASNNGSDFASPSATRTNLAIPTASTIVLEHITTGTIDAPTVAGNQTRPFNVVSKGASLITLLGNSKFKILKTGKYVISGFSTVYQSGRSDHVFKNATLDTQEIVLASVYIPSTGAPCVPIPLHGEFEVTDITHEYELNCDIQIAHSAGFGVYNASSLVDNVYARLEIREV